MKGPAGRSCRPCALCSSNLESVVRDKTKPVGTEPASSSERKAVQAPASPEPLAQADDMAAKLEQLLGDEPDDFEAEMGETNFTVSGFGGSLSMEVVLKFHKAKVGPFLTHVLEQVLAHWMKGR